MRASDRIEAAIVPLAALLVIVAVACAGVLGTFVYGAEKQQYLEEAAARHTVVATALDDSIPGVRPTSADSTVLARWRTNGVDRVESVGSDYPIKATDSVSIWVDAQGNKVDAPTPVTQAARTAVDIAFLAWWVTVLAVIQAVGMLRARITRSRDMQWERDIRDLVDGENGRTNRP
ncbi:hypothetical protein A5658_05280 [Mycobacterium sp. 1245111.1]|nr:hypothetical protein A5658_05280 [Mycobacterium sp. 1245111.1]